MLQDMYTRLAVTWLIKPRDAGWRPCRICHAKGEASVTNMPPTATAAKTANAFVTAKAVDFDSIP